jgi:hypothetical protein
MVIIRGGLVELGDQGTYAVIGDSTYKLLISLGELRDRSPLGADAIGNSGVEVRFLGTLEVGKKGLPFLVATAVHRRNVTPSEVRR